MGIDPDMTAHLDDCARAVSVELERRVRAGDQRGVEELLEHYPDIPADSDTALELIYTEYVLRTANDEAPRREDWYQRFPQWAERLERLFGLYDLMTDRDTHDDQTTATDPARPLTSTVLHEGDHPAGYELFEEIGRGGMAVVFRARQIALNRTVALKVLRGGAWLDANDVTLIRREAETAARLQHENIVQIHEIGVWGGAPYLSLEYVSGGSLAELLARQLRTGTAGVTPTRAAELVATLATAMHYAHERGIVHRDLKPANVLLTGPDDATSGVPKIADFGLAMTTDLSHSVSQTAAVVGTPCYMTPEQAFADRGAIGPRTDVYALGGILYELLTGRPPFQGLNILETLDLVRHAEPVAPRYLRPAVPRDLETICLKCLAKNPSRRYGSAQLLADDLRRFLNGEPIHARPVSDFERVLKWTKRHPTYAASAMVAVAMLVAIGYLLTAVYRSSELARLATEQKYSALEAARANDLLLSARAHWLGHQIDEAKAVLEQCPEPLRSAEWRELDRLCRCEIASFRLPKFNGERLFPHAVSRDGQTLFTSSTVGGREAHVIRTADGTVLSTIDARSYVKHASFGPTDDTLILIPNLTNTIAYRNQYGEQPDDSMRCWDLIANRPTNRFRLQPGNYGHSPNGRYVSTMRPNENCKVYDTTTGKLLASVTVERGQSPLWLHMINNDGTRLLAYNPSELRMFRLPEGDLIGTVKTPVGKVRATCLTTGDEARVIWFEGTGNVLEDKAVETYQVIAWHIQENRELYRINTLDNLISITISPSGHWLAFVEDRTIHVHRVATGERVASLRSQRSETPTSFAFSPDDRRLYSKSRYQLKVWDITPWCSEARVAADK